MGGGFTQPAFLGQTISVYVSAQNSGSTLVRVSKVEVSFDWYDIYTDDSPVVLQPGELNRWTFDDRAIPSSTWVGQHSYKVTVWAAWSDGSGGWKKDEMVTQEPEFAVQEPSPPILTTQTQGLEWCVNNQCIPIGLSTAAPKQPNISDPTLIFAATILILLLLVVVAVAVRRKPNASSQPTPVSTESVRCSQCGNVNPSKNQFCGKCGEKLAIQSSGSKEMPRECKNCHHLNPSHVQNYCVKCGSKLE